ncbi:hypothetical protein ACTXT7_013568, partial [Hymenolepis weldensis]
TMNYILCLYWQLIKSKNACWILLFNQMSAWKRHCMLMIFLKKWIDAQLMALSRGSMQTVSLFYRISFNSQCLDYR